MEHAGNVFRHLLPVLGELQLDQIAEVRKRVSDLKPSTVNLIVKIFLTMLRRAKKLNYRVTIPEINLLAEALRDLRNPEADRPARQPTPASRPAPLPAPSSAARLPTALR